MTIVLFMDETTGEYMDYGQAYHGYLITWNVMRGEFIISKDGYHICYAPTFADAKAAIDMMDLA